MTDFAFYSALQKKNNIFETKAQNRQMEIQILEAMDQRSEKKLQREAELDAEMEKYFQAINELDILEQDKERVQSAENRSRSDVIELVKKYNGNLSHFFYGGGSGALERYRNNVMESEEVKNAIGNKTNYAQWMHAQANGLFVKDVGMDVPVIDSEGNVTTEKRKMSMDEAYQMFEQGHIDKLPFDGAEKDIDVGPDVFQKLFKDPRDPYSQDTNVTPEDVYLWVRERGGSDDQARTKMNKYIEYINQGGTTWRYKSGDPLKKALMEEQIKTSRMKRSMMNRGGSGGGKGPQRILNPSSRFQMMRKGGSETVFPEEWEDFWSKSTILGLNYDKESGKWNPTKSGIKVRDWNPGDLNNPAAEYDLSIFNNIVPIEYTKDPKTGIPMLKLQVDYTDSGDHDDTGPAGEDFWGNEWYKDGAHTNNWNRIESNSTFGFGDEVWQGSVYVPVDQWLGAWDQAYLDKQINMRDNQYFYPASGAQDMNAQYEYSMNVLDQAALEISNQLQVSYDEALRLAYSSWDNTQTYQPQESGGAMKHLDSQR